MAKWRNTFRFLCIVDFSPRWKSFLERGEYGVRGKLYLTGDRVDSVSKSYFEIRLITETDGVWV
jgi:hypothetical protein